MAVRISGFSFVHNAIAGGYPIREVLKALQPFCDEVVCVDAASTDGTRALLEGLRFVRVLDAEWGDRAGETLARLHAMNELCDGDVIVHAEGDEVWDGFLLAEAVRRVRKEGARDLAVHRIQVEQNFQRARWYPWPVHRVFPRGSVRKVGETTDRHADAVLVEPIYGLLWDCTNCFRDNWLTRIGQQSALRAGEPLNDLAVAIHANEPQRVGDPAAFLAQPHWTWARSPFDLPPLLRPLVGRTRY